ncbi:MAG: hypothetical protein JNM67_06535, partial [Bacteroidetes bacterium]|nr:hypothetical protein [Bacteroidota bacterium]
KSNPQAKIYFEENVNKPNSNSNSSNLTSKTNVKEELSFWQKFKQFDASLRGHYDGTHSAPDAAGAVWQFGGTGAGYTGGVFIGMSRNDGFNCGFYGGGGFNMKDWSLSATVQAASGYFTWNGYSSFGTNYNLGFGPASYSFSRGGVTGKDSYSPFELNGLSFGIQTFPKFKGAVPASKTKSQFSGNASVTYTWPILK